MPDTITAKQLREERGTLAMKMRQMVEDANKDDREVKGLTPEEREKFNAMNKDEQALLQRAEDLELVEGIVKIDDPNADDPTAPIDLAQMRNAPPKLEDARDHSKQAIEQRQEFMRYAAGEKHGLSEIYNQTWDDDPAQRGFKFRLSAPWELEQRATTAQSLVAGVGGNLVADEMMQGFEDALKAFGGMRSVAEIIRTNTGANLPIPTGNDSTEVAAILAINTAAAGEDLGFGQKTFTAYKYTSKIVLVPMELMQDSSIDLPGYISQALANRFARGQNAHFTIGQTTDTQPQGIVSDSVSGVTAATQNTATYGELLSLIHSVDPAYRAQGARFMMNDDSLMTVKSLVDSQGRPLWLPGLIQGEPDSLLGFPYTINQDMASFSTATGAAKKPIIFGALNRYKIRDVRDVIMLRLDERYAEKAQTGFVGFLRSDGGGVIASTSTRPWMHLTTST